MKIQGEVQIVWLNEDDIGKPAKVKIDGELYSTFAKEMLDGYQQGDLVEIHYHVEKEKFKTIDSIVHIEKITQQDKEQSPEQSALIVQEARLKINKALDELEEKVWQLKKM